MQASLGSKSQEMIQALRMVAPGTPFRQGLDNILNAKTGALIVIGDEGALQHLFDGGFYLNIDFTPNSIYELAKMDGAVVLSSDVKRIMYANVHLTPDSATPTEETGTRHKTAERLARQTHRLVLAISQRRNIISLYRGKEKYILKDINLLLTKANQGVQTLERYRKGYDEIIRNLTALEIDDSVTLNDACLALKKAQMVIRMSNEIEYYLIELGTEGHLIKMQIEELTVSIKNDQKNLVKDYMKHFDEQSVNRIIKNLGNTTDEELMELTTIAGILGYMNDIEMLDAPVFNRGYRILGKIPRIPGNVVSNIINHFGDFHDLMESTGDELNEVEGVGIVRARNILEGFRRIKERHG